MSPPPLAIHLFGPMRVLVHGRPMPRVRTRSVEWILALLTLRHGRTVNRDWLGGTIWPESMESQALQNLRHDLVSLRKALGSEAQRIESPTRDSLYIALDGAYVDLVQFDRAVVAADESSLRNAVAVYSGSLLEGCYEEWVIAERETRARQCLQALERLADGAIARNEANEAIEFLRRAEAMDPLRDSIARRLMTALEMSGDPGAAVDVYRHLRERLYEELAAAPDPETTRVFHQIREHARRKPGDQVRGQTAVRKFEAPAPDHTPMPFTRPPLPLAVLIGRDHEVREVRERLTASRLVTLIGAGGVGKTRLAIEAANQIEAARPGRVAWVELAALAEGDLVLPAIAGALEFRSPDAVDSEGLLPGVAQRLSVGENLVVLDNCEHLLDSTAAMVQHILSRCPDLRVLATSRQRLGIAGEVVWRVPSLPVADPDQLPAGATESAEAALATPAVRLFMERAVAARTDFAMTKREDVESVCRICNRLDGIPLAIELAAARVRSLTVAEIQCKLDQRFSLLTGGSRAAMPRQRTLRSLIDWSYDLITDAEKRLLARLSVFVGGWTLDAAESVCAGDGIVSSEIMDNLASLVDQSLVVAETTGSNTRYHLLETVRQYARERLERSGEETACRDRHLDYFMSRAEEADPKLWTGSTQEEWLDRLETENDNLRAGLDWSAQSAERGLKNLRLCGALWRFWIARPRLFEGRAHLARALSAGPFEDSMERARALTGAGNLAYMQGDYSSARRFQEECLEMRRRMGDNPKQLAGTLNNLGVALFGEEDYDSAKAIFEDCLSVYREAGDRWLAACSLGNLGTIASIQGDQISARELYEECLSIQREFGDRMSIATSLYNLGTTSIELGDASAAGAFYRESLTVRSELGDTCGIASSLDGVAAVEAISGDPRQAARLWGGADRLRVEIGTPLLGDERSRYDRLVAACRARMSEDDFDDAWEEGVSTPLEELLRSAFQRSAPIEEVARRA